MASVRASRCVLLQQRLEPWVGANPIPTRVEAQLKLPGQLQLVAASPGCRHVRVSIRVPGLDAELTAWLAHELWHAVEIAGADEVRDQESLLRFYQRVGAGGHADATVETGQAQETWTRVLSELRGVR